MCTSDPHVEECVIKVLVGRAAVITNYYDFAANIRIPIGERHTLHCHAKGIPPLHLKWLQRGHKIKRKDVHFNLSSEKTKHHLLGEVEVHLDLMFMDWTVGVTDGEYTCEAVNPLGSDQQSVTVSGEIARIHKPNLILHSGKNVNVPFDDKNFSLTCRGETYHQLYWEKNQTRISTSQNCDRIALTAGSVCSSFSFEGGIETRTLYFGPINNMSESEYKCVETKPGGSSQLYEDRVTVTITGLPGVPPVKAVSGSTLVIDAKQNITDRSGFLEIPCLYLYPKENQSGPIDVKWFDQSNKPIRDLPHESFARILNGNDSNSTEHGLFAVKQNKSKSLILYIHKDSLASYRGNFTCKASSVRFASPAILRRVKITGRSPSPSIQTSPYAEAIATAAISASSPLPTMVSVRTTIATGKAGSQNTVVAVSVSVTLATIICLVVVYQWKLKQKAKLQQQLTNNFMDIQTVLTLTSPIKTHSQEWEIPQHHVKLISSLGEGFFGLVWKAEVKGIGTSKSPLLTAVKTVKDVADKRAHTDLATEASLLMKIGVHQNVIQMFGICSTDVGLWLIMEYAEHGNFQDYLRSKRVNNNAPSGVSEQQMFDYALQVAKGMAYLISMKCVHRDLAARNVLVCSGDILKISDFGMAKDIRYTNYYRKKSRTVVPIKWTSPEALLNKVYTEASDVWSYGIVLWEIATLGGGPYPGIPAEKLFDLLSTSYRMSRPVSCPQKLYDYIALLSSTCSVYFSFL
jgi:hypothetical protein